MSLIRLVYYSAVIGGWAAFVGWLAAELIVLRGEGARGGLLGLMIVGALVGAAIGAGINVVAGISNTQWKRVALRVLSGLLVGCVGGAVGILLGNLLYAIGLPRALGFMVLGIGVGIVDGLYERSGRKIRNGLIGGAVGGLVGGFLFDPLAALIASDTGIASRATAFVILGLCIGALIGFTQVIFREAWLTVLDGYRPGRQLILSQPTTGVGRADHLPLPFMGPRNADLDAVHFQILRQPDGSYRLEDNSSKLGVSVNHQAVHGPYALKDDDVIKMGTNFIRFNERRRKSGGESGQAAPTPAATQPTRIKAAPPPAPSRKPSKPASSPPTSPARQTPASPSPQRPTGSEQRPSPAPQPGKSPRKPPPPPPPGKKRT